MKKQDVLIIKSIMDDDYEYWDRDDEEFDMDNEVAITPVNENSDIIFEEIEEPEENFEDKEMKEKLSPPIMYEYEKTNIISKRKTQLDNNKPSTMEEYILKHKITSSFEIANIEFDNGKLPNFHIIREFDKGYYEKWGFNDFVYLPK
jgi:DNA-directed RNA polymerase subunit K/omega